MPVCIPQAPLLLSPVLHLAPVWFLDAQRREEWPANQPNSLSHPGLGCRRQGLPAARDSPSRGGAGALTVHVISMLFFLVPSPFTSLGLDSGAGTQIDTKVKYSLRFNRAGRATSVPPTQPGPSVLFLSTSLQSVPQAIKPTLSFLRCVTCLPS